jgi:P27 family predicted phage terminase small subunit
VTVSYPDPPAGLSDRSLARWDAFWASVTAQSVDLKADLNRLNRWIEMCDEYDAALEEVGRDRVVPGSAGNYVLNPLYKLLAQLDASMSRTESEFGMTPQGRKRIAFKAEKPQEDGDLLDEIAQRRARKASGA